MSTFEETDPFDYVPLTQASKKIKKIRKKPKRVTRSQLKNSSPTTDFDPILGRPNESRCHRCKMPFSCLRSWETPLMHDGFCPARISRPEDRELVADCPEGDKCNNDNPGHYEVLRHEGVITDRLFPIPVSQENRGESRHSTKTNSSDKRSSSGDQTFSNPAADVVEQFINQGSLNNDAGSPTNMLLDEDSTFYGRSQHISGVSPVKISARTRGKDGIIKVSLRVTDPDLKLHKLEMNIPSSPKDNKNNNDNEVIVPQRIEYSAAAKKQTTLRDFFQSSASRSTREPGTDFIKQKELSPKKGSWSAINCPKQKRISKTSFVVDAFNYGDIPGVSIYFLSHFHRDHYIGLTKLFTHPIICSPITARLVQSRIGVPEKFIRVVEMNSERTIDGSGITVTLLDANHCPGAVMFLFKFPDGSATLHTGDFRATPAMEEYPALWNTPIDTLHLDTTYCSSDYDFPAQNTVIDQTLKVVQDCVNKDPNVVILVGTYTIGKERIFTAIAEFLDKKIYSPVPSKIRILKTYEDQELNKRLITTTQNPRGLPVHVVSIKDARKTDFLVHYRRKRLCSSILAVIPTGWTRGSASFRIKRKAEGVDYLEVPYSEHSSYSELKRFVQFLELKSAESVIPTVNVATHSARSRLKKIFQLWIEKEETPSTRRLKRS